MVLTGQIQAGSELSTVASGGAFVLLKNAAALARGLPRASVNVALTVGLPKAAIREILLGFDLSP